MLLKHVCLGRTVPQTALAGLFIIVALASFAFSPFATAHAAQATLAWDTVAEATGYKFYAGNASRTYSPAIDVGNQSTYTWTGLEYGPTYYFAVTAYDGYGNESDYSVELVCDTISSSAGSNGSISPSGILPVARDTSRTFTITPAAGYRVADVLVDGASVGAAGSYTVSNIAGNHTIEATFAPATYSITASAGSYGSIAPSGAVVANQGDNRTFSITPSRNYRISDVKVDGVSVGPVASYTFSNITANHTIDATFSMIAYAITGTSGQNGAISPTGTMSVQQGSSQTFTITPNTHYHVADVLVDGVSVGAVTSYTFSNVSAAHTIAATFAIDTAAISASAGANGTISPAGSVNVSYGSSQAFTITPNANYRIADVVVDGSSAGAVSSYTFSNVTAAHTISATFSAVNQPPVADAGPDQRVAEGALVTLSGANSTDPDGNALSFLWSQTAGPQVVLSDSRSASPTFTAPDVATEGTSLTFALMVTDKTGATAGDTCVVNVTWVNAPPVASAGTTQTVNAWDIVTLDGSGSTDPDDGIASYLWEQTSGTPVALQNATTAHPTFAAPDVPTGGQTLAFLLTVTDNGGLKSTGTCIVNVTWVDAPPTANAGEDQTVHAGDTVRLDGSLSTDPDDGIASYRWTQTSGPPVVLSDPTSAMPVFAAPAVTADGTTLGFTLLVTDYTGLSSTAGCTIFVNQNPSSDLTGYWSRFNYYNNKLSGVFTVRNTGNANAGPFTVNVYLSSDGVALGGFLKRYTNLSLSPGTTVNLTFNYSSRAKLTGKYIIVLLDPGSSIPETNESNNRIIQQIR
ncbi:MAG: Ig-like domain-containing protein [Desulfobacteraceae bacterium]|nr:Ig-like domain-containing protein [Desulfobacteraceae bacterium]